MKSRLTTKFIYIFSILVILLLCINNVFATPTFITSNFIRLSDFQNSGIDLYVSNSSLEQDLVKGDFDLKLFFDGRLLLRGKQYPQNIKVEIYFMVEGKKSFLSILNRTVKNNKAAENILLTTKLPRITESTELYFDLYNANNILEATFKTNITVNTTETTEAESIDVYDCHDGDGECLIEYILRNLSFSAGYDRNLKTEVFKNAKGRYTVSIPVKKGRTLKSRVRTISSNNEGKTNGLGSTKLSDPYPYFQNDLEVASTYWDEVRDALKIKFENSDKEFNFKKDGSLQLSTNLDKGFLNITGGTENKAPIVFSQGLLLTDLVEGALEYDGQDLYFTNGSERKIISQSGPQGLVGPAGPPGPMGPPGGGGSSPAGSNGDIQFFSSGALAGSSNLNWNNTASHLSLGGSSSLPTSIAFVNNASVNGDLFSLGYDKRGIGIDGFALWRYQDSQWKNTFDIREDGKIFLGDYWHSWISDVSVQSNSTDSALRVSQAGIGNLLAVKKNIGTAEQFLIDNNGYVGVHGITPTAEFTVNGSVLIKDGTQADGFVLTSDVNGLASWQDVSTLVNGFAASASGTAGAIQFSNGSNGFDSNAANFYWDNTNGNLGIGTNTPFANVHVRGAVRIQSPSDPTTIFRGFSIEPAEYNQNQYIRTYNNSGAGLNIIGMSTGTGTEHVGIRLDPGYGYLSFSTTTTPTLYERMRINNMGYVGIADTMPEALLDVGNGIANFIDGNYDLLVADDAEIDGNLYVNGSIFAPNLDNVIHKYITVPAFGGAVGDTYEFVSFDRLHGAHNFQVTVTASIASYSVAKHYIVSTQYDQTAGVYQLLLPITSTGLYWNDFDLDIRVVNHTTFLRLRKKTGGIVGDHHIHIEYLGVGDAVIAELANTSAGVARPPVIFEGNPLTQVNSNVGINILDPIQALSINGSIQMRDGNQVNGYVMVSNTNGVGSWKNLSSVINGTGLGASGVAGAIQFSDGINGFNSDGTNLFWNNTTKRLGINNQTPNAQLTVNINNFSEQGLILKAASMQSANLTEWQNFNGNQLIVINPNGYLGVGVGNPNYLLTVNGALAFDNFDALYFQRATGNDLNLYGGHLHADFGLWARGSSRLMGIDGDTNNLNLYTTGISRSTLNSTGFGIGKAPAYKLDVNGSVQFQGANFSLRIQDVGASGHNITSSSSGEHIRFLPSNNTYFYQNAIFNQGQGTTRDFAIYGDINTNFVFADVSTEFFGIGTASPAAKLDVNGGILGNDLEIDTGYFSEKIKISDTSAAYKGLSFISYDGTDEYNIAANNSNNLEIRRLIPSASAGTITWGGGDSASAGRLHAPSYSATAAGSVFYPQYTIDSTSGDESGIYGSGGAIRFSTDRTDRLTIAFNGDVGIGTILPVRKLHISDTMRLEPRSTPPTAPALGDLYVDSDTNELCFYDGTVWTGIKAGGACI